MCLKVTAAIFLQETLFSAVLAPSCGSMQHRGADLLITEICVTGIQDSGGIFRPEIIQGAVERIGVVTDETTV
jgi:hypothetical protein